MKKFVLSVVFSFILIGNFMCTISNGDMVIKEPNVSGAFYDSDSSKLTSSIDQYFQKAQIDPLVDNIDILIVPHAGYVYSGLTAAYGFKAIKGKSYKTAIILSPSHYFSFKGISIWKEGGFRTPLGVVKVDEGLSQALIDQDKNFEFNKDVFEREHALEVEIPFLQKTFKDIQIVPVILGQPSYELLQSFALALKKVVGSSKDVLIVVSTDLSHYHEDSIARQKDKRAIEAIKNLDSLEVYKQCFLRQDFEMCGCIPVSVALLYAKEKELSYVQELHYSNSGEINNDRNRVVGYVSMAISHGQ